MARIDDKKKEWTEAINSVVSDKYETFKHDIIDCIVELEENYNASIHFKITNVPDVRFLTSLGKQRHFLVIRKSYEMHFYLKNPTRILKSYPFIRDKGSPKNHFQIIGRDVPKLSYQDLKKLILDSFCYIAEVLPKDSKAIDPVEEIPKDRDRYQPTKEDLEQAIDQVRQNDSAVPLSLVLNKVEESIHNQGYRLAENWDMELRKSIEKWFPKK